ncbi:metal-dependent hydrolase [Streptomyces sp. NPDC046860]|uniref:metal-dependent hydrolase n=1 Tax=Streptomyces sp. NPDC046860 TaxID=3154495 RepID=UPI0033FD11AD
MHGNTLVTFPSGALTGEAVVREVLALEGGFGVVCDTTPFHPVDHTWPDQPADRGVLTARSEAYAVEDCLIGAAPRDGSAPLAVGPGIPVRRGEEGWDWHVVHVLAADPGPLTGERVRLDVDAERRYGLSAGHTLCELAGLALNRMLAPHWTKEAKPDALGAPDFDKLAITDSRISARASVDHYRLGKSLRRKGFSAEGLAAGLPGIEAGVNTLMAGWIAEDAPVGVAAEGPGIDALRHFRCGLAEGEASALCGGTHVTRTGELGQVRITLELSGDGSELRMEAACS